MDRKMRVFTRISVDNYGRETTSKIDGQIVNNMDSMAQSFGVQAQSCTGDKSFVLSIGCRFGM